MKKGDEVETTWGRAKIIGTRNVKGVGRVYSIVYLTGTLKGREANLEARWVAASAEEEK